METKVCTGCKKEKLLNEFAKKNDKRNSRCKKCVKEYFQEYYHGSDVRKQSVRNAVKKYKEINKYVILAKRYNSSEEEITLLFNKYNGMCHICKVNEAEHVDHCHSTNVVRGVLCRGCNHGLGNFVDDQIRLQQAIDYLAAVYPLADNELKG